MKKQTIGPRGPWVDEKPERHPNTDLSRRVRYLDPWNMSWNIQRHYLLLEQRLRLYRHSVMRRQRAYPAARIVRMGTCSP
jgi:hypothetical protein